jgi:hypothetical protein
MKKLLLAAILVLTSIVALSQTFTSANTGNWTTGSTWVGASAPVLATGQLNNNVVIAVGHTVTLSGNLTVKNGVTLTIRGKLIANAVDFQNGSIVIIESGGILQATSLTNSNNSTNITINGSLTVSGNFTANPGSELGGTGTMNVSGTTSGTGTSFGQVLGCNNCSVANGVIIDFIKNGNQTNQSSPIEPSWKYTYSQNIYYKSEINQAGNITELAFEYNGSVSTIFDIDVYLGHTTKSSFSSTTNWISYSDLNLVYNGNYSVSNSVGWYSITFSTPFYYNNSDNLVIAVREKTSAVQSSSTEFYTEDGVVNRVLTYYDDVSVPNPVSPPTAKYHSKWVPSLRLKIEQPPVALPIELLYFKGSKYNSENILHWSTASEDNNDYFTIEKTKDGMAWEIIDKEPGAGNSSNQLYYSSVDENVESIINYYRLKQTDYDGKFKYSDIISIDNRNNRITKEVVKITNILGQEIDLQYYRGLVIIYYTDGSSNKIIK